VLWIRVFGSLIGLGVVQPLFQVWNPTQFRQEQVAKSNS